MNEANSEGWVASSGNVFTDLGVPDPDVSLMKSNVAILVVKIMRRHNLTDQDVSRLTGFTDEAIEEVRHGRLRGWALCDLTMILNDIAAAKE